MKKVLIALDYDKTARKVAEAGYSIAKAMNAEVILLHVIPDPVYYSSSGHSPIMGLTDSMIVDPLQFDNVDRLKEVSRHFLDDIKTNLGDEKIQTVLKEGDFADSILLAALDFHADIIVIGSHSRNWLENIIMGSVTEKILHHTSTPLFIVPNKRQD